MPDKKHGLSSGLGRLQRKYTGKPIGRLPVVVSSLCSDLVSMMPQREDGPGEGVAGCLVGGSPEPWLLPRA
eukprot:CAMPEP_0206395068 /NCGR_PEP_ID=MMETSP0294-20121207/21819_1 /ASSEMBLY_ACC=CAM_ASM_000327 /TAXON_ID=39354 /ORGANISM="Heterosigma akashiwo, Strain CCMP2393" /LENGTH=70 /DNA_ID=CAMNT_0053849237 /DNA_START=122 /DNA_END=334 /DNA_ORIENTATION=-